MHHVISQKETTFTSIIRDVEVHSFSIINSYFGAEKGLPFSLNLYNIVGFEDCTIRGCFFRKNSFIRKLKGHCFSFEENKIEDDLYLYNISLRGDNHYLLHNINNDRGTPWKKCLQEFQKYCHEACFENNAFENIEEKFKADKQNNTLILFCNIRTSDQALLSLINIGEKENAGNIALVFLDNDLTHGSVHIKNFDLKYFRVDEITSKKAVQYSDCKLAEYQEDIFTVIDVFRQNIIQKDNCYGCYDITEEDVFPLQKQNTDRKDRSAYASITILIASILLYAYSPFVPFSNAVYNLICFIILLIIYNIVSCLSLRKAWHFMIPKEGIISSCKSEKLVLILFVIVIIILTILAESNPNIFPDTLPWALIIFYGFWFIKDYFNWYPNQHDTSPFIVPDKDKDKDKAAAYCKQQRELFSHLKERAFEAHRFAESRHYHLLELRWLRSYYQNKKGLRGFFSWFFLAVYDVTSGIGIAIVRPLTSSFLSFLLFSIIFYVSFLIQNDNIQNLNSFTVQNKNPQDQWQEVIWKNSKEISVIDSFTFAKVPSLIASLILMEDGDETCSPPNKRSDSDLTRFTKPFCFQAHPLVRKTFKHYLAMIIIFQTLLQLFFALQILSAIRHKAIHYTN